MTTPPIHKILKPQRIQGGFWGALLGDAMGVPVEFYSRFELERNPVTAPRGGRGTAWEMPVGTWSDDGALLLCTAEVLANEGMNPNAMGELFLLWDQQGYWTATGKRFDIGGITSRALDRIASGVRAEKAGPKGEQDNGNGSLMRILPVAIWSEKAKEFDLIDNISRVAHITHGHPRATAACVCYALMVRKILEQGETNTMSPREIYHRVALEFGPYVRSNLKPREQAHFLRILNGHLEVEPEHRIQSSGYVMDTLEASLWCFANSSSYEECVLKAINLGGDTDTTGIVAGGLAGLYYGIDAVPFEWRQQLKRGRDVHDLVQQFIAALP